MGDSYLPENMKPTETPPAYLPENVQKQGEEKVKIISHPQPRVATDEDRRSYVLEFVKGHHRGFSPEQTVNAAKKYEAYLKGETSA